MYTDKRATLTSRNWPRNKPSSDVCQQENTMLYYVHQYYYNHETL